MYSKTQQQAGGSTFGSLVTLAINIAIIYYVLGLEKDKCKCVRDWRHDYIKYYTGVMIFITVVRLLGGNISVYTSGPDRIHSIVAAIAMVVALAMTAAVGVQIYSIFTYVGDLNKTKCTCATEDMRTLNRAMLVLRWFYIAGAVVITLWLLAALGRVFLRLSGY
jgi:cation transport ATPase